MTTILRTILFLSINGAFVSRALSQTDTALQAKLKNAVSYHNSSLRAQLPIYNGKVYEPFLHPIKENGHSYFLSDNMVSGSVVFDGVLYDNVRIKYNQVRDLLILEHYDQVSSQILDEARVERFSLADHNFINLKRVSSDRISLPSGYYDVLYNGKAKLLAKTRKKIVETPKATNIERHIEYTTRYYILKESEYHQVNSARALLKLLKLNGNESHQYLSSKNLSLKRDQEDAMISLMELYDKQSSNLNPIKK